MSMFRRGFFKSLYEIHEGGDLLGTLSFTSAFGGRATGVFAGESWTFKRTGFFTTRVVIRKATSEFDDAVFQSKRWSHGGTLTFPDGRMYSASTERWEKDLRFLTSTGETVMTFCSRGGFAADIEVIRAPADLPLFLLLGCYIVAVMLEESASAGAAVAAVG
jgi:hypothetical protein